VVKAVAEPVIHGGPDDYLDCLPNDTTHIYRSSSESVILNRDRNPSDRHRDNHRIFPTRRHAILPSGVPITRAITYLSTNRYAGYHPV
jgi:hypothetical protein